VWAKKVLDWVLRGENERREENGEVYRDLSAFFGFFTNHSAVDDMRFSQNPEITLRLLSVNV
jgi:hypothetical protein